MIKSIGKKIKELRNLSPYENLKEILGFRLGKRIYDVINNYDACIEEARKNGFDQGAVFVVAEIIRTYDRPTMAIDILNSIKPDLSICDNYDVKVIRKTKGE